MSVKKQFIKTKPVCKVTFTVDAKDANTAAVVGDFNNWNSKEGDLPVLDMSIDQLQKRGVLFCVCDMALTVYSGKVAKKMGLDAAAVKKDWLANLLPNIEVVPSGVWAINRAQEHRCSYCFAG